MLVTFTSLACTPFLCEGKEPLEKLESQRLEAVHAQRVEWMKQRVATPTLGVYTDFRAVHTTGAESVEQLVRAARAADVRIVISPKAASRSGAHDGILLLDGMDGNPNIPALPEETDESAKVRLGTPKEQRRLRSKFKQYPDEVYAAAGAALLAPPVDLQLAAAFRHSSTHILAREMTELDIRASLAAGHFYTAHDWLCDPSGFSFHADTDVGMYDIGDDAPLMHTIIEARLPIRGKLKLFGNDVVLAEANDSQMKYAVTEEGAYRLEVWLTVDGEDRPWIYTNPVNIRKSPGLYASLSEIPPNVEVRRDVVYKQDDPATHKLDLYLPKGRKNFPVLVFVHGGAWNSGNKPIYGLIGYAFAKLGMAVAMPKNPQPAQIEDVATSFAWVYQKLPQLGGDVKRLYLIGHSAGARLAALLALDREYLEKYAIPASAIRGVAAVSGVYDVAHLPVHPHAPRFLITYCQWDYEGLPKQARDFAAALKKNFVGADLVYIPGENHISELLDIGRIDDLLARAILNFIQ